MHKYFSPNISNKNSNKNFVIKFRLPTELGIQFLNISCDANDQVTKIKDELFVQLKKKELNVSDFGISPIRTPDWEEEFCAADKEHRMVLLADLTPIKEFISPEAYAAKQAEFELVRINNTRRERNMGQKHHSLEVVQDLKKKRSIKSAIFRGLHRDTSTTTTVAVATTTTTTTTAATIATPADNTRLSDSSRKSGERQTIVSNSPKGVIEKKIASANQGGGTSGSILHELQQRQEFLGWKLKRLSNNTPIAPKKCVNDVEAIKKLGIYSKLENLIRQHDEKSIRTNSQGNITKRSIKSSEKILFHYNTEDSNEKVDNKKMYKNCILLTNHRVVQIMHKIVWSELAFGETFDIINFSSKEDREIFTTHQAEPTSNGPSICFRFMDKRSIMFSFSNASTAQIASNFFQKTILHYNELFQIKKTLKIIKRMIPTVTKNRQIMSDQQMKLTRWSELFRSLIDSMLFSSSAIQNYRLMLEKMLWDIQNDSRMNNLMIDGLTLEDITFPKDAEESPLITMAEVEENNADNQYNFEIVWMAPSLNAVIKIIGKQKVGIKPQLNLQFGALRFYGILRLRIMKDMPLQVSFTSMPNIAFNIVSRVTLGNVKLPFQEKIEQKITELLLTAIQNELARVVVGDKWFEIVTPGSQPTLMKGSGRATKNPGPLEQTMPVPPDMHKKCQKYNLCYTFQIGQCRFKDTHMATAQVIENNIVVERQVERKHICCKCNTSKATHAYSKCPKLEKQRRML